MHLMLLIAFLMVAADTATAQTTMKTIPAPPDVAAPPADAAKTKSGLASRVIKAGTGKTHQMFDSSVTRGEPAKFPLDRVIAGWTEGVQLMVTGETRRLWIPEPLAYQGKRDPKGLLVFDVELISFVSPPQAPPDVKAPPSDAKKTPSGLAYRVQKPGTGSKHPMSKSEVTVHYTGWTTNGQMFDSSVTRGEPATFPLDQVIAGWTEGVQLMVEGEKTRFWIPENLAYKGQAGAPAGMLVFDVELIKIR